MQLVVIDLGQMEHGWKRLDQLATHVAGELVRAAEKHGRFRITDVLIVQVPGQEFVCCHADCGGAVGDAVVGTTPDERHVTGEELECRFGVVDPQPGLATHDGVDGELDGAGKAQAPGGSCDRASEDAAGRSCSSEVFLQHVHLLRVSHSDWSVGHIDALVLAIDDGPMTESNKVILVLGGTGKTGTRVASRLTRLGLSVRTAARQGADVRFDWDDPATHRNALEGADRVYLVAPVMRTRFAPQVSAFLDIAEAVEVRHVTYLSAYGTEFAPSEVALRAVELDLLGRSGLTHSIVRPAWFMQDFSETFLMPVDGAIVVPTGHGGEAFVDAEDIAGVVAATLSDPEVHAGAEYAPTGPDVLTVSEAADIIGIVTGRPVRHVDIDRLSWVDSVIASGVPPEYGEMLQFLTETVASGRGSRPNGDVEKVTGARPRNFSDFARRTAAAWTGDLAP
ncbi:MAG: NmrA family protein [Acidimicrobiaceae bacterium]|nr:NmrA family protein [Acidimicrobiaceae bacterium]